MKNINTKSQTIKILMTADTVGGVWTCAIDLAKSLARYGVEIHLATMGALPDDSQREQAKEAGNIILYESEYKLEWMQGSWHDVDKAGEWLMELETKITPDLIHLNNYAHATLPWNAPTLLVCHSCVLSWWEAVKGEKAPSEYLEYYKRVRKGILAVDIVIAPSQAMLTAINRIYECDIVYSKVIPNGTSLLPKTLEKEEFIFSMGRVWDEAKNICKLNAIAPDINWPIVIAGDQCINGTDHYSSFSNLNAIGKLNQNKVKETLEKAAIYVLPAKYEPFGLSILEAAKAGCALILGDIPSLRENWSEAALFVDTNDEALLSSTINMLIEDSELLKKYADRAKAKASHFNINDTADAYLDEYAHLIQYYTKHHFA